MKATAVLLAAAVISSPRNTNLSAQGLIEAKRSALATLMCRARLYWLEVGIAEQMVDELAPLIIAEFESAFEVAFAEGGADRLFVDIAGVG